MDWIARARAIQTGSDAEFLSSGRRVLERALDSVELLMRTPVVCNCLGGAGMVVIPDGYVHAADCPETIRLRVLIGHVGGQ